MKIVKLLFFQPEYTRMVQPEKFCLYTLDASWKLPPIDFSKIYSNLFMFTIFKKISPKNLKFNFRASVFSPSSIAEFYAHSVCLRQESQMEKNGVRHSTFFYLQLGYIVAKESGNLVKPSVGMASMRRFRSCIKHNDRKWSQFDQRNILAVVSEKIRITFLITTIILFNSLVQPFNDQ